MYQSDSLPSKTYLTLSIAFVLWIFFIVCIAVYCARDARPMSSRVIASVKEQSFFDALHANTAAKITISIHFRLK